VVKFGTKSGTILKNGIITHRGSVWNDVQYEVRVVRIRNEEKSKDSLCGCSIILGFE
jgi:hypothetical protein